MKRRDFLKLIGIAPVAPNVLTVVPKKELTVAAAREHCKKTISNTIPVGFVFDGSDDYIEVDPTDFAHHNFIFSYVTGMPTLTSANRGEYLDWLNVKC